MVNIFTNRVVNMKIYRFRIGISGDVAKYFTIYLYIFQIVYKCSSIFLLFKYFNF